MKKKVKKKKKVSKHHLSTSANFDFGPKPNELAKVEHLRFFGGGSLSHPTLQIPKRIRPNKFETTAPSARVIVTF